MSVYSSHRGYFNGHIFAKLEDDLSFLQRICYHISVTSILIIFVYEFHETSNKMRISAVVANKVTSESSFLSPVEKFRDLDLFEDCRDFLIFVFP